MNLHQPLTMATGAQLLAVDAADFDGATNLDRGAALTGVTDSKQGILSFWFKPATVAVGVRFLLRSSSLSVNVFQSGTTVEINMVDASVSPGLPTAFRALTTTAMVAGSWYHILSSWDCATAGARSLYLNDVSDMNLLVFQDLTPEYATGVTDYDFGHSASSSDLLGCVAEFYFAPGQYLDFSIVSNRRKFISANGKPVYLGATAALPTGTAPAMYMHLDDGETAANFGDNLGTGGTFSTTAGALTTCANSPSG